MPSRVEEVVSKAAGLAKAAKATVEGLSGVFTLLTKEHGEVSALLMRVKASSDVQVRRELFPTISRELLAHEIGEVRAVYPAFQGHPELAAIATEHVEEASKLEEMLNDLSVVPFDDDEWAPRFAQLVDLVKQHTSLEENEYFPKASRILGKADAERIQAAYEETKANALQQMSSQ